MFEEMTEQQAREQILEMTRNYCEKYHNKKTQESITGYHEKSQKGTVSRMRPEFMMQKKW